MTLSGSPRSAEPPQLKARLFVCPPPSQTVIMTEKSRKDTGTPWVTHPQHRGTQISRERLEQAVLSVPIDSPVSTELPFPRSNSYFEFLFKKLLFILGFEPTG